MLNYSKKSYVTAGIVSVPLMIMLALAPIGILNSEEEMKLEIDLQDGFSNDVVEIKLDDEIVYSASDVTTKMLLGIADTVKLQVAAGTHAIVISIKSRSLEQKLELETTGDHFIGVSLANGMIEIIQRDKPFGYG